MIIICRNPYKRLISGFFDKYKINGEHRKRWIDGELTFNNFVNVLIKNEWKSIEKHHFTPQTTEYFKPDIIRSKSLKIYDLENIDYSYLEQLFGKTIPEDVINKTFNHSKKNWKHIRNRCLQYEHR